MANQPRRSNDRSVGARPGNPRTRPILPSGHILQVRESKIRSILCVSGGGCLLCPSLLYPLPTATARFPPPQPPCACCSKPRRKNTYLTTADRRLVGTRFSTKNGDQGFVTAKYRGLMERSPSGIGHYIGVRIRVDRSVNRTCVVLFGSARCAEPRYHECSRPPHTPSLL